MIRHVLLGWLAASGVFLLGWRAGIRWHLTSCEAEKAELIQLLLNAQMRANHFNHEREREGS